MNSSFYVAIAIISLAVLVVVMILTNRIALNSNTSWKLSPLAAISFAFILSSIAFGENRIVGYSLMGIGVVLAVLDIFQKSKK